MASLDWKGRVGKEEHRRGTGQKGVGEGEKGGTGGGRRKDGRRSRREKRDLLMIANIM